jgi:excisionase family DNA binding protein
MVKLNPDSRHQTALWAQADAVPTQRAGDPLILRRDGLLTPRQAAELCGVGVNTIYTWVSRKMLPVASREGHHILLNLLDVLRTERATRAGARRAPAAPPAWQIEGEPEADPSAVLRACLQRVAAESPIERPRVYYIRFGDRIKIGTTKCLTARLSDLPHDEVLATEPGGRDVETRRHRQFAAQKIRREWFRPDPVLLEHIAALVRGASCAGEE